MKTLIIAMTLVAGLLGAVGASYAQPTYWQQQQNTGGG